jgi:pyridoxamine 5'-phosphate oxidase
MNEADATAATLAATLWQRLAAAPANPADPLRTPVLATGGGDDWSLRTVVLRAVSVDDRELTAYSDARAAKIRQALRHAVVQWLFYDPAARVQIRLWGRCRIHHRDPLADAVWETVPEVNRVNYRSPHAPGEPLTDPSAESPGASGGENFAVLLTTVDEMDWLELGTPRHRRMRLRWADGEWTGQWIQP